MSSEKYAEILEKAADLLESGEAMWIQGDFEVSIDPNTGLMGHCAVGALCRAAGEAWGGRHPVTTEVLGFIKPHVIDPVMEKVLAESTVPQILPDREAWNPESAVIMFNDRIADEAADVIEVFKLTAKDLRNQA